MKYELKRLTEEFLEFCRKDENKKISIITLVLICFALGAGFAGIYFERENYLYDNKGKLVAIKRSSEDETLTLSLRAHFSDGKDNLSKEVLIDIGNDLSAENKNIRDRNEQENKLEGAFEEIVNALESSKEKIVYLPNQANDDSISISWEKSGNIKFLLLIFLYPMIMAFMYESKKTSKKKEISEQDESIRKGIPRFCNKLLLLMDSGLVFEEAFNRIALNYDLKESKNYFEKIIVLSMKNNFGPSENIISILSNQARQIKSREFSKLIVLLEKAQCKGTDLRMSLKVESELLWDDRKTQAEEKGKSCEIKLSFPLTLMLISLIVITGAPAILQM